MLLRAPCRRRKSFGFRGRQCRVRVPQPAELQNEPLRVSLRAALIHNNFCESLSHERRDIQGIRVQRSYSVQKGFPFLLMRRPSGLFPFSRSESKIHGVTGRSADPGRSPLKKAPAWSFLKASCTLFARSCSCAAVIPGPRCHPSTPP